MGFDPLSMMVATTVASGLTSGAGSMASGNAQAAQLGYRAQVAQNNAAIARKNAEMDIQAGDVAATNQGLKTRAMVGQTMADQGASGVDVNTGSFVSSRAGEAEAGMIDALTIRSDAAKRAYAQEVQATSDIAESRLDTSGAASAETAGQIGAASSLLGSASSAFGEYRKWKMNVA